MSPKPYSQEPDQRTNFPDEPLFLDQTAAAAERSWTDVTGRKIQAEYIASDSTNVTLSISRKHHQLPLTRLSAADLTWIVEQKSSPTAKPAAAALPSLTALKKLSLEGARSPSPPQKPSRPIASSRSSLS